MKRALDTIAERGRAQMRREHVGAVYARALQKGLPLLPAAALVALLLRATESQFDALGTLAVIVLPYAYYVAIEAAEAFFIPVTRSDALGRVDRELHLHDRLRIADEFLTTAAPSGFMQAAILDAGAHLESARAVEMVDRGGRPERRGPWFVTGAFLLFVAALQLTPGPAPAESPEGELTAVLAEEPARRSDKRSPGNQTRPPRAEVPQQSEPPAGTTQQKEASEQSGTRDKAKRRSAATGRTARTGGTGAQARSADATGAPSAAGRASAKKLQQKPKDSKSRRQNKPRSKAAAPRAAPRRDSGATSGSARSSGSSKNPTASDWKTRDTPPEQREEPEAQDAEVDDESEDSESRGGVQPNLRGRKPPVNRDLGIGFGNRASRRANGRGGASQRKKSRGTASLVLGVPVPDHIKGQPNPGMTKVTRERGEPERESADPVQAGSRRQRSMPSGAVPRAEMPPWLRQLIRRYFLEKGNEKDE